MFFCKQKTAYEISACLVGSEMCIRDRPPNAVLFVKTGLCGGFTTFSAFSLETLALLERGKYATGALYACGSVLACLAGVVIGRLAVRGVRAALTGSAAA